MGRPRSNLPPDALFMQRVNKTASCWLWTGPVDRDGYGEWQYAERRLKAHRWSHVLFLGEPGTLQVCHACDVPACVNPAHLFLGTQADNVHDMQAKGRICDKRGERHHMAKLSDAVVLELRAKYDGKWGSASALARAYGMKRQIVYDAVTRRRWRHLP